MKGGIYEKAVGWEEERICVGAKGENDLKCLGNKYPQVIFNLNRTHIQEFKSKSVISNCQSYSPN